MSGFGFLTQAARREAYWISKKIAENLAKGTWLAERIVVICKRLDLAQTLVDRFGHDHVTSAFWRPTGPLADIEIQQVLACLRLIANRSDDLAVRTCLETRIALGIGTVGIRKLRMEAERASTSLWETVTKSYNYNLSKWTPAFEAFANRAERWRRRLMYLLMRSSVMFSACRSRANARISLRLASMIFGSCFRACMACW